MSTTEVRTLPSVGTWTIDPSHSEVGFSVRHLGISKTKGRFGTFTGAITVSDDPEASSVTVEIEIASIDTRDAGRDEHLRSADFFDAATFPSMTFRSTRVTPKGDRWLVEGDLTIKGVTKHVALDTEVDGVASDPWGGQRAAFRATTEVNRDDFGLTWNQVLDTGGLLVGKTVKIDLEVEAVFEA